MAESTIELWDGIYRRIYAAALRGKRINSVSLEAEAAFWRLHLVADDYGGFDADPLSLRVTAFRKRPEVTEPQIQKWLKELGESKLIQVYPVCEDTFGTIIDFIHFQPAGKNGRRVRKYPPPVHSGESKGIQGNPRESIPAQQQEQQQEHKQQQRQGGRSEEIPESMLAFMAEKLKGKPGVRNAIAVAKANAKDASNRPKKIDMKLLWQFCVDGRIASVAGEDVAIPVSYNENGLDFSGKKISAKQITWESIVLK